MREAWVPSLGREDPERGKRQPTPVFLPGESHGRRSLVGYSPRGRKESNMTERLYLLTYRIRILKINLEYGLQWQIIRTREEK